MASLSLKYIVEGLKNLLKVNVVSKLPFIGIKVFLTICKVSEEFRLPFHIERHGLAASLHSIFPPYVRFRLASVSLKNDFTALHCVGVSCTPSQVTCIASFPSSSISNIHLFIT